MFQMNVIVGKYTLIWVMLHICPWDYIIPWSFSTQWLIKYNALASWAKTDTDFIFKNVSRDNIVSLAQELPERQKRRKAFSILTALQTQSHPSRHHKNNKPSKWNTQKKTCFITLVLTSSQTELPFGHKMQREENSTYKV